MTPTGDVPDWWQTPEFQEYALHFTRDAKPKIINSAFTLSLVPNDVGDVKYWTELGASIMFDKPIVAIVDGDHRPDAVPGKLREVADKIVHLPAGATEAEKGEILRDVLDELLAQDGK